MKEMFIMVKINIDEINRRMENAVKIKELREKSENVAR